MLDYKIITKTDMQSPEVIQSYIIDGLGIGVRQNAITGVKCASLTECIKSFRTNVKSVLIQRYDWAVLFLDMSPSFVV